MWRLPDLHELWPQRGLTQSWLDRSMRFDGGAAIDLPALDYRLESSRIVNRVYARSSSELLFSSAVDESSRSALVWSPDGRFELLGDRAAFGVHVRCRIDHRVLPFSACTEAREWAGLHRELTRGHAAR